MIVVCAFCGKEVKKVPAKVVPVNFCSRQCSGKYRTGKPFHSEETKQKIREAITGKSNPAMSEFLKGRTRELSLRWKGDNIARHSGRHRAQNWYPMQPCEVCGLLPDGRHVHRHHKDGNTLNNSPENISFLCTKHHWEHHRKEKLCHQL